MIRKIPFDIKISRLLGAGWPRDDIFRLGVKLYEKQGAERASMENRIIILFDQSETSDVRFFELNRGVIMEALEGVVRERRFHCWLSPDGPLIFQVVLIPPGKYRTLGPFYEHPIGEGLREPKKAEFETIISRELEVRTKGLYVHNPEEKEHGVDGWIGSERL